ncbi:hypothetical protein B0H10DRAFT_2234581 [Mycena sp. CBHHK59/15]|nr:hypothetical protein B0H10DRAFT_2234581 [Mycena sp. CBHHK59/15]
MEPTDDLLFRHVFNLVCAAGDASASLHRRRPIRAQLDGTGSASAQQEAIPSFPARRRLHPAHGSDSTHARGPPPGSAVTPIRDVPAGPLIALSLPSSLSSTAPSAVKFRVSANPPREVVEDAVQFSPLIAPACVTVLASPVEVREERDWKYELGWSGVVSPASSFGTPNTTDSGLAKRTPLNTCITLGSDWNNKISSIGPDPGTAVTLYGNGDCFPDIFGTPTVYYPGYANLNDIGFNDQASSFYVAAA